MASPFFDAIRAGVSGAPGTGAITVGAVASGFRAFANVPANIIVDYRVEDGSDWEIGSGLWNGATLARGLKYSSTGALLALTAAATVSLIISADEVQPHIGGGKWGLISAVAGSATPSTFGIAATTSGSAAAITPTFTGSLFAAQHRTQFTSATVAGSSAGASTSTVAATVSSTAMVGGFEFVSRWGANSFPSGPRLLVGLQSAPVTSSEPSTLPRLAAFAKDSTDTNIQFMSNNVQAAAAKVDTGIPLVAGAFYETAVWADPGLRKLYWSIARLDTGASAYGAVTNTAAIPPDNTGLVATCLGGLGTVTGTAFVMHLQSLYIRSGQ